MDTPLFLSLFTYYPTLQYAQTKKEPDTLCPVLPAVQRILLVVTSTCLQP